MKTQNFSRSLSAFLLLSYVGSMQSTQVSLKAQLDQDPISLPPSPAPQGITYEARTLLFGIILPRHEKKVQAAAVKQAMQSPDTPGKKVFKHPTLQKAYLADLKELKHKLDAAALSLPCALVSTPDHGRTGESMLDGGYTEAGAAQLALQAERRKAEELRNKQNEGIDLFLNGSMYENRQEFGVALIYYLKAQSLGNAEADERLQSWRNQGFLTPKQQQTQQQEEKKQ